MKAITLHPLSVLFGLALAGLAFLLTGAAQIPIPTRTVFVGEVPAEWWTYVTVEYPSGGTPMYYTVPPGRRLVVTALVTPYWGLLADGQRVDTTRLAGVARGNGTRGVFEPGTVLSVEYDQGRAELWGYLEPL